MNIEKMKMDEVIKEINRIYKKSKEEGLTEEETEYQAKLRRRYIDSVKMDLGSKLEGIEPRKK